MNEPRKSRNNIEHHRITARAFGFIAALSLVLAVLAWSTYESAYQNTFRYVDQSIEEEELVNVRIMKKVSKPKPPQRQVVFISPDPEPDPEPDPDPDQDDPGPELKYIDIDGYDEGDEGEGDSGEPEFFIAVGKMPALGDCNELRGEERKVCTEQAILRFFYRNTKYPKRMKDARLEGVVYLSFIVDREGQASKFDVLRSSHEQFSTEVLRVAERMPTFEPGEQRGIPVPVQYTIPVRFKLE